ncbi:DUF294 nucleotidyltransferase-like domain-containing protein [Paenibacillus gansuensis]|uniref:DUF294 nucleotidyltransferase-like domain-containing protein n=1 Tax=Paenibacillus gansuensis TaxID=306542 RepID=A0ABW5PDK5_9BACL
MQAEIITHVLDSIRHSRDVKELRAVRDKFHERCGPPVPESQNETYVQEINLIHDALIRRTIQLSEQRLAGDGMGPPPVSYAFVLFGSGGRREQTLWSDQDNGLIYADPSVETAETASSYFEALSDLIVFNLQTVGYPPCEGNVTAMNAQWRKSITEWNQMIYSWMTAGTWEQIRHLLIVADARCVYGNPEIAEQAAQFYAETFRNTPQVAESMLNNTLRHKILLGVFGNFLKEQYGEDAGSIDIKYGAYIPFVNGIRLLSVCSGITETSTLARLAELKRKGSLQAETLERWAESFVFIMMLRSTASHKLESGMFTTSGKLKVKLLTKEVTERLRSSLRDGKGLQRTVQKTAAAFAAKGGGSR